MATTVGQHSVAAFTSPVNGTTPIDANTVRGNDNTVRVAYVDHDADPGIHVQSSTLASRPAAGTAGRKWINSDYPQKLWYDDGTDWHEVGGDAINVYCKATETIAKGDIVKVTGYNTGQDVPEIAKVASASDVAFGIAETAIANGSLGYVVNTGIIQGVATNSFSLGNILYPNTSGGLTATKPTSGTYQTVAYVLRAHASSGVLYVEFSAPRIVEASANTASTVVLRDASGDFSAGTINATAINTTTLDLTNLEVTNIKAKDGTAAASIADSTGVVTITHAPILSALTASQAVFTNASKALVSNAITGTGNVVMSASPTLTGTVTAATLNATTLGGTLSTAAQTNITSVGTLSSLTVSGNITASGGTANGVGYLNASKVLTTGTALVFDGTNLGIGKASPAYRLDIEGASPRFWMKDTTASGSHFEVACDTTSAAIVNRANLPLQFGTNNSVKMTLDASGNLGVGTASPEALLHLNKAASGGEGAFIFLDNSATSALGNKAGIRFATNSGATFSGYGSFIEAVNTDAGNGAEAMTFGTWNGSARAERARITSGGYFKASNDGTYVDAGSNHHEFRNSASDNTIVYATHTHATNPYGFRIRYTAASPNNTDNWFLYCDDSAAQRFSVRSNGGVYNYQANDSNLSDERVKTDVKPVGSYWDKFKAIEIVTFKYKDQTHDDDNIGVIAQQVEAVAPEFIDVDGFGEMPENGEPLKAVYTTDLYHAAIKALQEAMARIEALEVEVAALKAGA